MGKFFGFFNPVNWAKSYAKKYALKLIDEDWERYETEAIEYVKNGGWRALKGLSDKWQERAKEVVKRW